MRMLCCAATRATCVLLAPTSAIKLTAPVNSSRNVLVFNVHYFPSHKESVRCAQNPLLMNWRSQSSRKPTDADAATCALLASNSVACQSSSNNGERSDSYVPLTSIQQSGTKDWVTRAPKKSFSNRVFQT
ncbi:uncharacterized protein BJ212DRAFT_1326444 [Suillus subaureus]|uniref:Secreted protein n=1 Tax=Suillus subaureus TaxID=48587 RepID=A0A9P7JIC9_9AGAM|nr:uncharacterized protein BJ212DRAFT_1326444 [Suillus subaureus]KAG1823756.1 hypothetical protein BJ212DRAFT_1326444 [Suillus subaureus]